MGSGDVSTYYQVSGSTTVATGVKLELAPGTVWKFNGNSLTVNGALLAEGTPSEKIVFTSYRDDSSGCDANNNGFSSGAPGDW